MTIELIKENEKGTTFQAEGFKILYRHKGKFAGDNDINKYEILYLISGSAKVTILDEIKTIEAPSKFIIPEKTYHKIDALTDIALILFEK